MPMTLPALMQKDRHIPDDNRLFYTARAAMPVHPVTRGMKRGAKDAR